MDLKTDIEGADLIQRGRAFHKLGAATEKARSPLHFSLDFGMLNLWFDDRRVEVCYPTRARRVPKYFRVSGRVRVNV